MSNLSNLIEAWRRQVERADGVNADDVTELESRLTQEMDSLQKLQLRPDEAFVIASRRLGHPCELTAEYSKNDSLAMWKRPARLLLWGMLSLLFLVDCWIAVLAAANFVLTNAQWANQVTDHLIHNSMFASQASYAMMLVLLLALAGRPQGLVARSLAKLEHAIQTGAGAVFLVLAAVIIVAVNFSFKFLLRSSLNEAHGDSVNSIPFGVMLQLALPSVVWYVTIAILLVLLARGETPQQMRQLASE